MKHTPGPWRITHTADDSTFIDTDTDDFIAQVRRTIPEYEENAHLIAAAPDLLEALQALFFANAETFSGLPTYDPLWDKARTAIAKAEGRI